MSVAVLKNSLFGTGADDTPQMARVLGVLYLSGGLLIALSLLLPHPEGAKVAGLLVIVAIGVVAGSAQLVWARRLREWMVHGMLALGTFFICLAEYFAGVGGGVYSAMFLWVVLMAASFFQPKAVAAQVAWVVFAWAVTLASVDSSAGFPTATRLVLGSLVLIVAAIVMTEIVAGRRSTEKDRERLQRALLHLAHHDPLTGVANRRLFEQALLRELASAKRRGAPLCLLALDLDRFKAYNDEEGHVAGDHLLKASASAWAEALRAGDLLARLGGDEFIALLPDCSPEEAERVAARLIASVPLGESCSTGIACWDGQEPPEALVARADKAMYAAKTAAGTHP